MHLDLPVHWVILLNVFGWPVIQMTLAWAFTAMPSRWFPAPAPFHWERSGKVYEQWFGIKRWKDRLPDAAAWFSQGFAKGHLDRADEAHLRRFAQETWRGELCHWVAMACAPIFYLWNPLWACIVMTTYALLANLPCILAQRYNRARFCRVLGRRSSK
jgi:glycosyl-4,4'-diaponeurosporenoate acyltransferase